MKKGRIIIPQSIRESLQYCEAKAHGFRHEMKPTRRAPVHVTGQLADSESTVDRFLRLSNVTTADLTESDVAAGASLLETHAQSGIGGRNATVLAAMDRHDVSRLWTHDEGLKRLGDRLDWLPVTDPVEDGV